MMNKEALELTWKLMEREEGTIEEIEIFNSEKVNEGFRAIVSMIQNMRETQFEVLVKHTNHGLNVKISFIES